MRDTRQTNYRLNPLVKAVEAPPIAEARQWAAEANGPILDTAQAVPGYPPAPELRRHLAEALQGNDIHLYTAILGLPELREALADHMSAVYGGSIAPGQVAITAGCNQAFCLAISALAGPRDDVILPVPYYFNHRMWLDMQGVRPNYLPCRASAGQVPDADEAASLIGPRTRAIVLVTPNNPTGAVYPPEVIARFHDLARMKRIALVIDETYKDFLPAGHTPHELFRDPGWPEHLVQLYSFSKAYSLTGHRVGSIIGAPAFLESVEKIADCVAICAPRPGQVAALFGLENLDAWREDKRRMMAARLAALREAFADAALRYELVSSGAYFAYLRHPFTGEKAADVARRLAREHGVLCLPGPMFGPDQEDNLRVAFANLGAERMPELAGRLLASQETPAAAAR
ncbi:MAG: aminotransferase [Arenicellales bacterium]